MSHFHTLVYCEGDRARASAWMLQNIPESTLRNAVKIDRFEVVTYNHDTWRAAGSLMDCHGAAADKVIFLGDVKQEDIPLIRECLACSPYRVTEYRPNYR